MCCSSCSHARMRTCGTLPHESRTLLKNLLELLLRLFLSEAGVLAVHEYGSIDVVTEFGHSDLHLPFPVGLQSMVSGPKGGLRSLFNNLMLHPQTIGPKCADTKFFSSPATIRQGVDYYLRFFPEDTSSKSSQQKKPLVTGEVRIFSIAVWQSNGASNSSTRTDGLIVRWNCDQASAEYFQKPHVPKSMNKFLPELKLIASLRNPTDAFISKWLQTIKSDPQRVSEFERTTGKFPRFLFTKRLLCP